MKELLLVSLQAELMANITELQYKRGKNRSRLVKFNTAASVFSAGLLACWNSSSSNTSTSS